MGAIVLMVIGVVLATMGLLVVQPYMSPTKFGALCCVALVLCGVALHINDRGLTEEQRAVARVYP